MKNRNWKSRVVFTLMICFLFFRTTIYSQTLFSPDRIIQYSNSILTVCLDLLASTQECSRLQFVKDKSLEIIFQEDSTIEKQQFKLRSFVPYYNRKIDLYCQVKKMTIERIIFSQVEGLDKKDRSLTNLDVKISDYAINYRDLCRRIYISTVADFDDMIPYGIQEGKLVLKGFGMTDPDSNEIIFLKGGFSVTYKKDRLVFDYKRKSQIVINGKMYTYYGIWVQMEEETPVLEKEINNDPDLGYPARFIGITEGRIDETNANAAIHRMKRFISENLNIPEQATTLENFGGIVPVGFHLDINGRISDLALISDIGYGSGKEAIRLIKLMDNMWIPCKDKNGIPRDCRLTVPIEFD